MDTYLAAAHVMQGVFIFFVMMLAVMLAFVVFERFREKCIDGIFFAYCVAALCIFAVADRIESFLESRK